ncbi:MAG: glycosyltransferase family 1 protein [Candidatus Peregrinibacteria bacterium]|nr:glycosyltransferase family 1 protein [Candidatus Peregrinibacteria bacterium]
MHITILADSIDTQYAGIHHYTKNLIENLLKIDDKNTYTIIHPKPNKWLTSIINTASLNDRKSILPQNPESIPTTSPELSPRISEIIIPRSKFPGGETIRRFFKIPKIINKISPDIVIEPCHIGPFRLKKGIRKILIVHDITPILFPHFHTFRGRFIHKLFLKKSLKNADIIITPSQTTKDDILKKYQPKAKISVIHLGVNPIDRPIPSSKLTQLEEAIFQDDNTFLQNFPNLKPYLLYLGTIEPRKNLETLVDAFIELKTTNEIPHKLVLAGQIGWKSKTLLKKIAKYNKTQTPPHSPQIITTNHVTESKKNILLQNADIFIYPSLYEGFGLPPLEAMNAGIPVICSKGGSLKGIYKNTALLFNPNDKETLKKHILSLIKNTNKNSRRNTLIKNGLSFAKTHTWQKTAKETLKTILY